MDVNEVVRLALSVEYARVGLRVKTIKEITDLRTTSEIAAVIMAANEKLINIFGMKLVRLPKILKKADAAKAASEAMQVKQESLTPTDTPKNSMFSADSIYVLQNCLPEKYIKVISNNAPHNRETGYMGVVAIVVSLIAFSGGMLEGQVLTRYLNALNLEEKIKSTSLISLENTFKLLVKHMYIEKEVTVVNAERKGIEFVKYTLGKRALREFTQDSMIKLCEMIMKNEFTDITEDQVKAQLKHTALMPEDMIPQIPASTQ
ncbi:hypothetical protein DV113_000018 [Geotrichum candidum]|nr:hypothetical protein DV113_000018 [Geotrichum candidum]